MIKTKNLAALTVGLLLATGALAQSSPVGLWKSIDDGNGQPKALIRISDSNGELKGKIEKIFPSTDDKHPNCDKCEGANKGQPILGMTIVNGMRAEGSEFTGGTILDPNNGKVYKSKMTLSDEGKKLNVRGYIGMPMLGRTQVWLREE
ncbi:DUF2147 domain-containing protein [Actimicrobium sp. CCC2.4]|uniref:DUF2147 domain-containing protein n=1 Tax=Actimicrobium sp. CCC2.4 TaxID=3048606 RepID=UPI002AC9CA13|nr:DUF2147 domain-containing protein [Actimicrobium sp. CCC2.4]MEB0136755.1 DUF2147 domain-containing protein [Actimicrobium sp. CCC2.4]WPX33216.1 DUF2147 domain-containing protein [Actimicrobium sp. CCC2.4]